MSRGMQMMDPKLKEVNNYKQGRTGAKSPIMTGPAKTPKHNPTKGGGINRATKGR